MNHNGKVAILVSLPNKEARTTVAVFGQHIRGVYGAGIEVITDEDKELMDDLQGPMEANLIDHRTISASHPQVDGLAERCVQTVYTAMCNYTVGRDGLGHWDNDLPHIALGYSSAPHGCRA